MTAPKKKTEETGLALTDAATALGIPLGLVDIGRTGDEVMDAIVAEIAAAGSFENALKLGTIEALLDFDGQTLTFHSFHYQPSDFDKGPNAWPYVVVRCTDAQGELRTVTTGARKVVAMLALARQNDELPVVARIEVGTFTDDESGETRRVVNLLAP